MGDTVHCYPPAYDVLRNKLNLPKAEALDRAERRLVVQRVAEGVPSGEFDLDHLRAIHRHLFQDVDDRVGDLRTVEIAKGGHQFQFRRFIEPAWRTCIGGRWRKITCGGYLAQLAARAGHAFDLLRIGRDRWIEASREAHLGRYGAMAACIEAAMTLPETGRGLISSIPHGFGFGRRGQDLGSGWFRPCEVP